MTEFKTESEALRYIQKELGESDINMANRLGVRPKLYGEFVRGEKYLNDSQRLIVKITLKQIDLEKQRQSTRELFDQLGCSRHWLAANLNLKPNRIRGSIEYDNDALLQKVLSLSIKHPELNLIEKLSDQ
jgi:hypothetical protein